MPDREGGNVVNLHLSHNGRDGEVGGHSGSKDQNERKTPDESFSDHEENSSSALSRQKIKIKEEEVIEGRRSSNRKSSRYSSTFSQAHHQLYHLIWSHLLMMIRREVNLNLRNLK